MAQVKEIHIYPTKSCQGLALDQSQAGDWGLEGDRLMMLVKPDGTFLTQRAYPKMGEVGLYVEGGDLVLSRAGESRRFPKMIHRQLGVKVWGDEVQADDLGDDIAHQLSQWLGIALRVVAWNPAARRWADRNFVDRDVPYGFADGFPYLISNQQSLVDLNDRLQAKDHRPISMTRFRPNIVIEGWEAYQEDRVSQIKIGNAVFELVKPCTRCRITTIDPDTMKPGPEPLKTLMEYRYHEELRGVTFGQNAVLHHGSGTTIRVGDEVTILGTA
ncbi:MOSC domain-containing protein [Pseudobacteriovorax antillogorgiicola]|uniref:MOSC domain-containing protein n=1 Tax=Pseudobacteriovorax antillogorgiicola TaxID=1513793 RepID=UPI0013562D73|nr:MOSC N-terminal beta barrel domain-containing protein [Pseudobacteriovorax antillogorgiicola]